MCPHIKFKALVWAGFETKSASIVELKQYVGECVGSKFYFFNSSNAFWSQGQNLILAFKLNNNNKLWIGIGEGIHILFTIKNLF